MNQQQITALKLIAESGYNVGTRLSNLLGITRQAASARLKRLLKDGLVEVSGTSRARFYRLKVVGQTSASYPILGLNEDLVWRGLCLPFIAGLPENLKNIWHYGITEMVNNAIDHSGSNVLTVGMERTAIYTTAWVSDDGEGIFLKIQKALGLYDPRESILELAKGKFTTDPANHSGEGIFFSSKMFDMYDIRSGNLHFMHDDGLRDVLTERDSESSGTVVLMRLNNDSARTSKEVFDRFSSPDEYTFDRTIVPVRLAAYEGENLVSRSQAKRLTMRFERFRHVILDFEEVHEIGQAFADEVFRVFRNAHPSTEMIPRNMSKAVSEMIMRAQSKE
jgi:biotin operon repressor